jgi:hypothetical protein
MVRKKTAAQFQVARDMLENRPKCCSGVVLIALLLLLLAPCHGKAVSAANNYAPALLDYDSKYIFKSAY